MATHGQRSLEGHSPWGHKSQTRLSTIFLSFASLRVPCWANCPAWPQAFVLGDWGALGPRMGGSSFLAPAGNSEGLGCLSLSFPFCP